MNKVNQNIILNVIKNFCYLKYLQLLNKYLYRMVH